ncbi:MAG: ribosome small subunit-dependent GTPase A [Tatlockia sp.]|jgi:ribosome biogenesis GTPase
MSKRRINKQQALRIKKIQTSYQQDTTLETQDGLVITRFRRHAEIEDASGKRILCSIRPNLDSLVAGDKVIWQLEGEKQGIILSLCPRESMLGRFNKSGQCKPVAANITQIIIVVAVKPEISLNLLDSYLVMLEHLGLEGCIVLNKVDLPCETLQQQLVACYEPLGYRLLFLSKKDTASYELLKEVLNNQISVFVGQSGVGKSSLISAILPHETNIATAEISTIAELGCHTTSNSRLYHLPSGGALIDSPGIRELALGHLPPPAITKAYPELRTLSYDCKFRNCNHMDSPGCAIVSALQAGKISATRYESYIKLIQPG